MERNLRLTYGLLNEEEVKASVLNQFMGGGIMCATEPLDKIDKNRLMEYRRILPILPSVVRPISLMDKSRFPGMVDVYIESMDAHYLCVINWDDEQPAEVELCIGRLLPDYVKSEEKYLVCDYYSGKYYPNVHGADVIQVEKLAPHGAAVFKICRMQEKPMVVKSTVHYSMGGEFELLTMEQGEMHYIVNNPFDCPIAYDFLLPEGWVVSAVINPGRNEELL